MSYIKPPITHTKVICITNIKFMDRAESFIHLETYQLISS